MRLVLWDSAPTWNLKFLGLNPTNTLGRALEPNLNTRFRLERLTSGEKGCLLVSGPKLALGQPNNRQKKDHWCERDHNLSSK